MGISIERTTHDQLTERDQKQFRMQAGSPQTLKQLRL